MFSGRKYVSASASMWGTLVVRRVPSSLVLLSDESYSAKLNSGMPIAACRCSSMVIKQ